MIASSSNPGGVNSKTIKLVFVACPLSKAASRSKSTEEFEDTKSQSESINRRRTDNTVAKRSRSTYLWFGIRIMCLSGVISDFRVCFVAIWTLGVIKELGIILLCKEILYFNWEFCHIDTVLPW